MAGPVMTQQQTHPSFPSIGSSLSDFNGARLHSQIHWQQIRQPKVGLHVTAPREKKILVMDGTRFGASFFQTPCERVSPVPRRNEMALILSSYTFPEFGFHDIAFAQQSVGFREYVDTFGNRTKAFAVPRKNATALILTSYMFSEFGFLDIAFAEQSVGFREYIDTFDGYSFKCPQNWIQVRGAGADIFFRDPYVLDENISVELSSPSSSRYKSVEDLGPPQEAGRKVLKQYLTEFMSTRLGVRRKSNVLSTSSRVADDGRLHYQVEVNIKSYATNNELAVMPKDRIVNLEWDRRYLSVLGVENNSLYELRLQTPENVFVEEESDLRQVIDSFRVNKVIA